MITTTGSYPYTRLRRLRQSPWIRDMIAESILTPKDIIWPIFVREDNAEADIEKMPGVRRFAIHELPKAIEEAYALGIPAINLFPNTPEHLKTDDGSEAWNPENLVNRAIRIIKKEVPDMGIITDVALDPYTSHGHDGVIINDEVANDESVEALVRQSLVQAESGANVIAPSDMMDGRVAAIRKALDAKGFKNVSIMSYSAKYNSAFYGPFRQAVASRPVAEVGGDLAHKLTYQLNPADINMALREVAQDIEEGADMIIVKPGMPYLDVVSKVSTTFNIPVFAYQVSGEYSVIKAAAKAALLDEEKAMLESLIAFKRAGASGILTYFGPMIAKYLKDRS